ncbi:MAG TPA: DUF1573 domain-containing protein [Candidatus Hydrogenedentes bacterium]|nr:DUF1573 domain-containing protein [Candidatus Hydrogenedentota bacterium]
MAFLLASTQFSFGQVEFPQSEFDLGVVKQGPDPLMATFKIVNRTLDAEARIVSVRSSCGCLSASAKDTVLSPGELTVLQLKVDTLTMRAGPFRKYVHVVYEQAGSEKVVQLTCKGSIVSPPVYRTLAVDFGEIRRDEIRTKGIRLEMLGNAESLDVVAEKGPLKYDITRDTSDGAHVLLVSFEENKISVGRHRLSVRIFSDCQDFPLIEVPVQITVLRDQALYPDTLVLDLASDPASISRRVRVGDQQDGHVSNVSLIDVPAQFDYQILYSDLEGDCFVQFQWRGHEKRLTHGNMYVIYEMNGVLRKDILPYCVLLN